MKISTRGRYGIRLLCDLARHSEEEHIPLAVIAARQKISSRYLEQVAVILRQSGYIRSVKGASGGYSLARSTKDINIGAVLQVLEGDLLVVDNPSSAVVETCFQKCIREFVYASLNERIASFFDDLTLADVLEDSFDNAQSMYFI